MVQEGEILWEPSDRFKQETNVWTFMTWLKAHHAYEFSDYEALWEWSVDDIERCWQCL